MALLFIFFVQYYVCGLCIAVAIWPEKRFETAREDGRMRNDGKDESVVINAYIKHSRGHEVDELH